MAAFEELYRLHGPRVYALACRMLDGAADAEDLLQEVFLLVFRKVGGFKGERRSHLGLPPGDEPVRGSAPEPGGQGGPAD